MTKRAWVSALVVAGGVLAATIGLICSLTPRSTPEPGAGPGTESQTGVEAPEKERAVFPKALLRREAVGSLEDPVCRLLVVTPTGAAVSGAELQDCLYGKQPRPMGVSGADGIITVSLEFAGVSAAILHPGFRTTFLELPTAPGEYIVTLQSGHLVTVQVSAEGRPLPEVLVCLANGRTPIGWPTGTDQRLPSGEGGVVLWRQTGQDGIASFQDVTPGKYWTRAQKKGYVDRRSSSLEIEVPSEVNVSLEMDELWGAVVDLGEEPLELKVECNGLICGPSAMMALRNQFPTAHCYFAGVPRSQDRPILATINYYCTTSGAWKRAQVEVVPVKSLDEAISPSPLHEEAVGLPGELLVTVDYLGRNIDGVRIPVMRVGGLRSFAISGRPKLAVPGRYTLGRNTGTTHIDFDMIEPDVAASRRTTVVGRISHGHAPIRLSIPGANQDPNGCLVRINCGNVEGRNTLNPMEWLVLPVGKDISLQISRFGFRDASVVVPWAIWKDSCGGSLRVELE